ncbi:MAG: hypothetical protein AAFN93_22215, partial [Bacteroidota bacterium]
NRLNKRLEKTPLITRIKLAAFSILVGCGVLISGYSFILWYNKYQIYQDQLIELKLKEELKKQEEKKKSSTP